MPSHYYRFPIVDPTRPFCFSGSPPPPQGPENAGGCIYDKAQPTSGIRQDRDATLSAAYLEHDGIVLAVGRARSKVHTHTAVVRNDQYLHMTHEHVSFARVSASTRQRPHAQLARSARALMFRAAPLRDASASSVPLVAGGPTGTGSGHLRAFGLCSQRSS